MSLTVTQRPSTTISGETSRWNAIAHPLLYKMQRKDFQFASINNSGGFVQLVISGNVVSSFDVGDLVWFSTDGGVYAQVGEVTASAFSSPNTLVTLDVSYISSSTGWVNNDTLRPSYRVNVFVYNSANALLNESALGFSPDESGGVRIDIMTVVRAYLNAENASDLTASTDVYDDTNAYLKFYIKYQEAWTDSAQSVTNDSANQFFAVLGANQIPSLYGSNMAEHVTFDDGTPKPNWLTKFDSPVMWRGYPFVLSAIIGDGVTGDQFVRVDGDDTAPAALSGKIIQANISEILSDDSPDEITATIFKDASPELVNEITIELRDPCSNPVMLMGRNSYGGVLQWLFDETQEYEYVNTKGNKVKRMTLIADDLTVNQWESLQDFIGFGEVFKNNITEFTSSTIKTSTRIGQQVYTVDTDGNKVGVIVLPTGNRTKTHQVKHKFELDIEFPETFLP